MGQVDTTRRRDDTVGEGLGIGVDDLEVGAVLADAQRDRVGERHRVERFRVDVAEVVNDGAQTRLMFVAEVEAREPLGAVCLAVRDAVEVGFHLSSEVVLDEVAEVLFEQAHDREGDPVRHESRPARGDVAPVNDGRDDRGVGAGAADAALF